MTGRLAVKGGKYYVVISYKDENGKYKNKWIATGLDERNNKRAATDMMREIVSQYENDIRTGLFLCFLLPGQRLLCRSHSHEQCTSE